VKNFFFVIICIISIIALGGYFYLDKKASRKAREEHKSTQSMPSWGWFPTRPDNSSQAQLSFSLLILYFIIFLGGIILAIFLIGFIQGPVWELFPIICVVGLIALHVYFSFKVIKAYRRAATERKSTETGFYSQAQKKLIRAILYFITFWGCIILTIIILKYWLLPLMLPPPELVGQALEQFLEQFLKLIPFYLQ
jgi:fatty acid desaturase